MIKVIQENDMRLTYLHPDLFSNDSGRVTR